MTVNPWMLAVPIMPVGVMAAGLVLLRLHQKQRAVQARITSVVAPTGPKQIHVPQGIARREAGRRLGWRDWLGKIFGFDPAKADQYRIGWLWVLLVTMVIGRVVALLAAGLLGPVLSWLLMPAAWVMLSRTVFARSHSKRRTALLDQFPDALSLIVRAVRVGIPVTEALRAVAREAPEPTQGGVQPRFGPDCHRHRAGTGAAGHGGAERVAGVWLLRCRADAPGANWRRVDGNA